MKSILHPIVLSMIPVVLCSTIIAQPPRAQKVSQDIDNGRIALQAQGARIFVGDQSIRVRRQLTEYRPSGKLPILQASRPTDNFCRAKLAELIRRFDPDARVYYMRDVLVAKSDRVAIWVNRASGSFKVVRVDATHAQHSSISEEQAIQTAIDFIAQANLIKLSPGEEIDLLGVSELMNRVTQVGEPQPKEEFLSDYYVVFGRRIGGVPVVGSRLVVRINGKGEIAMVEANWRQFSPVRAKQVTVRRDGLDQLVIRSPEYRGVLAGPKKARVIDSKCGYIEAAENYVQTELHPGCRVLYRGSDQPTEEPSAATIPLERQVASEVLLGRRFNGQSR